MVPAKQVFERQAPAQLVPVRMALARQELERRVPAEQKALAARQHLALVGPAELWLQMRTRRQMATAWQDPISSLAAVVAAAREAAPLPAVVRLELVAVAAGRTWLRVPPLLRPLSGARSARRPRYQAFPGESESC